MHPNINASKCILMQGGSKMHSNAPLTHVHECRDSHTAIVMQKNVTAKECNSF